MQLALYECCQYTCISVYAQTQSRINIMYGTCTLLHTHNYKAQKRSQMVLVGHMYYARYSVCVGEEGEGGKG